MTMPENTSTIGERIKEIRIAKELSVEDVSKKTGITVETLDQIEDDKIAPLLGSIVKLAEALEVSVGECFGESADSPFCIVRSDNRKAVSRFDSTDGKSYGYSYEALGLQKKNRQMEPFLVTLAPTNVLQVEANEHIGEEFIFVLKGDVEVRLHDNTDILHPGDSIYYDSTIPHTVTCHGEESATILAVIYAKREMIIF